MPVLLVLVLPWYILNNLPALQAMLNLPSLAMEIEGKPDTSESRDFSLRFDRLGAEYGDDYVANAEAKPLGLDDVASGGLVTGPETPVKDVTLFDANSRCALRYPGDGEKVMNVSVRGSGVLAPVRTINTPELLDFLEAQVAEALSEGRKLDLRDMNQGSYGVVDVYVTDTSAPLYLVLQAFSANTLWNLHAAPGVEIAHVAMISGGASGLTGDVGTATYEGLRASDFGSYPEMSLQGDPPKPGDYDCMAWPFQQPNESWTSWQGSKEGNTLDGNLLFGQTHGYEAYELWYGTKLGGTPAENAVVTALARAALVGPVPAEPVAFAAQDGLQLRLMRHDLVFTGNTEDLAKKFDDHYQAILAKAAGGDIAAITRPEVLVATGADQPKPADVVVEGDDDGLLLDFITAGTPWEQEFDAFVDMENSNIERRVGFDQEITLDSLLAEGEAMPPEDQQLLYALMRTPAALEYHCLETLIEIATKCRVITSTARKNETGNYSVSVRIGYVPNYAIGALTKDSGWAFVSVFLPDATATSPLDTPKKRQDFLRRLMKTCDKLREELGNCVISTAGFYLDRAANFSGGGGSAWAAGWVSVYSPDNRFEEEQLTKKAEDIWNRTK